MNDIPDRLYFRIGETSKICGLKPHVLRYWETEFNEISPQKTRSGQRLYRRRDLDAILAVKRLLHEKKYTIEGARKALRSELAAALEEKREDDVRLAIESAILELKDLRGLLE